MAMAGTLLGPGMPPAGAGDSPTLDYSIARALAHSPEIAMAEARLVHAEAQLRSARWGWFHPEVRVYAGESAVTGATRAGIQVSQDVVRLLTLNGDEVRTTRRDLILARQELALATDHIVRQVHETRARLQRLEQAARLNAQLVANHDALLSLVKTQFEQGSIPLAQVLATQEALAQAQQTFAQTQAELHDARVAWAQLLGEPLPVDSTMP